MDKPVNATNLKKNLTFVPAIFSKMSRLNFILVLSFFYSILLGLFFCKFNFDLHHDGYTLTQSLKIAEGGQPYKDVFVQYGLAYHYMLALLVKISSSPIILSKKISVFLHLIICYLFCNHLPGRFSLKLYVSALWLIGLYSSLGATTFFVQLHPNQLSLLLYLIAYRCLRAEKPNTYQLSRLTIVFFCIILCLNLKINHGLILALIAASIYIVRKQYAGAIFIALAPLACQVAMIWGLWGWGTLIGFVNFHYKFSTNDNFLFSFYHLFALNYKHGYIQSWMILLWLAPLSQLITSFSRFSALKSIFHKPKKNQLSRPPISALTIFSICSWFMVFPTGSYQHVYYAGFFSFYFLFVCLKKTTGKFFPSIQIALYLIALLQYLPQNYIKFKFYENFVPVKVGGEQILVDPFSVDVFVRFEWLERLYKNQSCKVLNLTPNAIFMHNSAVFCSVDSPTRNFTWRSDKRLNFEQFNLRLKQADFIISPDRLVSPKHVLIQQSSVANQEYGANYFFYATQNINANPVSQTNSLHTEIARAECSELSEIVQRDRSLPVIIQHEEKSCALHADKSVSDQTTLGILNLYYKLYYLK